MNSSRRPSRSEAWLLHLRQLVEFKAHEGHANPHQRYRDPATGFFLGGWLSKQREAHRRGTLPTHQYVELLRLGVEFDGDELIRRGERSPNRDLVYEQHRAQTWTRALEAAAGFVADGGDLNEVRRNTGVPEAPRLGKWIYKARSDMTEGALPQEVAAAWEELGLDWVVVRGGAGKRRE